MNMQTGINIVNAVKVVRKTYDNINKMMAACQNLADGKQVSYLMLNDAKRFLRYKSDRNIYGWMYSSFILLFQNNENNNVLYVMDINIGEGWGDGKHSYKNKKGDDVAVLALAKFIYDDVKLLESGIEKISPADYWKFTNPLYELDDKMDESDESTDFGYVVHRTAKNEEFQKYYMSLNRVVYTTVPLHEVTADTLKDKIFGTFDKLADL